MSKQWIKPLILILALLSFVALAQFFGLGDKLGELKTWIVSFGSMGPVIFILLYAIAAVMAVPGSALTLLGGAIFGSFWGVIYVLLGATVGATLAFFISRYLAREAIVKALSKSEKFKKLDEMTEKHGAIMVALTRLVPLFPFNLLNYGFGLTKVPLKTYVGWTFLCMFPGTALYVVGADAITLGIQEGRVPWLLVGVLLVIFALLTMIVRQAKKILEK